MSVVMGVKQMQGSSACMAGNMNIFLLPREVGTSADAAVRLVRQLSPG